MKCFRKSVREPDLRLYDLATNDWLRNFNDRG